MGYPSEALIAVAFRDIELALVENTALIGSREAIGKWREVAKFITVDMTADGATDYDSLANELSDSDWIAQDLYNGPND